MRIPVLGCSVLLVRAVHGAGLASQIMAVCATASAAASVEGRGGDFRSHIHRHDNHRTLQTAANTPNPTPGIDYSFSPTAAPTGFDLYGGDDDDVYSLSLSYDLSESPTPAPVDTEGGGGGPGEDAGGALGSETDTAAEEASAVEDDSDDGSSVGTILLIVLVAFVVGAALVLFRTWRKRRSSWQSLGNNEALLP